MSSRKKSKSSSLNTVFEKDILSSSLRSGNKSKNKIYSKHTCQESELKMIPRLNNVSVKSVDKFRRMADQHLILHLQPQKKVEIFDSHAIDFSKLQRLNSQQSSSESLLLPTKTKEELGIEKKHLAEEENLINSFIEHTMQADGNSRCTESVNASRGEFSRQTSVGNTLVYTASANKTDNDTLNWYMKYKRQKQFKEDLLRKIQSQAHSQQIYEKKRFSSTGRVSHLDSTNKSLRKNSEGLFPSIFKTNLSLVDEKKSIEKNRERFSEYQTLPNLPREHSALNVWRDPRFQNLLLSLVPREESHVQKSFKQERR